MLGQEMPIEPKRPKMHWDHHLLEPDVLEPEVGLEPTTCALRGTSIDSRSVSPGTVRSHSVLVTRPPSRFLGTDGTQRDRLGPNRWDKVGTKRQCAESLGPEGSIRGARGYRDFNVPLNGFGPVAITHQRRALRPAGFSLARTRAGSRQAREGPQGWCLSSIHSAECKGPSCLSSL